MTYKTCNMIAWWSIILAVLSCVLMFYIDLDYILYAMFSTIFFSGVGLISAHKADDLDAGDN